MELFLEIIDFQRGAITSVQLGKKSLSHSEKLEMGHVSRRLLDDIKTQIKIKLKTTSSSDRKLQNAVQLSCLNPAEGRPANLFT